MNAKHLCVGILSLLITSHTCAFNSMEEAIFASAKLNHQKADSVEKRSCNKSKLNKLATLITLSKKNPDLRARRHGAGGAAFGVFLGQALVWGTCHLTAAVAGTIGTPFAGAAVETAVHVGSPFIAAIATKASLGLGIFFGAITGPV